MRGVGDQRERVGPDPEAEFQHHETEIERRTDGEGPSEIGGSMRMAMMGVAMRRGAMVVAMVMALMVVTMLVQMGCHGPFVGEQAARFKAAGPREPFGERMLAMTDPVVLASRCLASLSSSHATGCCREAAEIRPVEPDPGNAGAGSSGPDGILP
jgi:hypothetical protein